MRKSKIFTLCMFFCMGTTLLVTSCSKDSKNEEKPTEGITAPFQTRLFSEEVPTLPTNLKTLTNAHAEELVEHFEEVTSYSDNKDIMSIPAGAVLSHTPVDLGNAQPANMNSTAAIEYTVYTYTVKSSDQTIEMIYQFSVQNGMDVFELFMGSNKLEMMKMFEIRQTQDGKSGTMTSSLFGLSAFYWTWEIQTDGSLFITYSIGSGDYKSTWKLHYNKDMSGNMKLLRQGNLVMEYTWDSAGNGTWSNYLEETNGSW